MKLNYHGVCPRFASFEDKHCTKEELNKMWPPLKSGNDHHYDNVTLDVLPCMPPASIERVKVHQHHFHKEDKISTKFALTVVAKWKGYNINWCLFAVDAMTRSKKHPWKRLAE